MTPSDLQAKLITLFPEFAAYWDSPDNFHRKEDGSSTLCGVFAEFSAFVREQFAHLPPTAVVELGHFLEKCLQLPDSSELRNAADTCFLENVAGEDITPALAGHFGSRARESLSYYGPLD